MPIDEVITQLEQALLEAAKNSTKAAEGGTGGISHSKSWADITHTLAEALALVRGAYTAH
jgi:hypothetical protein